MPTRWSWITEPPLVGQGPLLYPCSPWYERCHLKWSFQQYWGFCFSMGTGGQIPAFSSQNLLCRPRQVMYLRECKAIYPYTTRMDKILDSGKKLDISNDYPSIGFYYQVNHDINWWCIPYRLTKMCSLVVNFLMPSFITFDTTGHGFHRFLFKKVTDGLYWTLPMHTTKCPPIQTT